MVTSQWFGAGLRLRKTRNVLAVDYQLKLLDLILNTTFLRERII